MSAKRCWYAISFLTGFSIEVAERTSTSRWIKQTPICDFHTISSSPNQTSQHTGSANNSYQSFSRSPWAPKWRYATNKEPGKRLSVSNLWCFLKIDILQAEEQSLHATDKSSAPTSISEPPKNKKGPKGPNPLSVKKKAIANPSTHITRQTNEMPATRGMKRKREVADDERDSDDEIMANKKRKRKRKHKSSQHT